MAAKTWDQFWVLLENSKDLSGGQGTVRKVFNATSELTGALKQIHSAHLDDTERRCRMAREVLALERIRGGGIPEVFDHNMEHVEDLDVSLYLVTRWIDGWTLQRLAGGRPQPIEEALRITRYLAATLNRCHNAGVLHRDIKPENVVIDQETGLPVLVDFGLAWSQPQDENTDSLTSVGQELGNRFFRLPDLSAGQEKHDARTDVTFLVGILFFLLTGVAPRQLIDPRGLPPHEALANRFPENVVTDERWQLIRRIFRVGFQTSIEHRFQSASDLIQRLDEIIYPREGETKLVNYQPEVDAIRELLQSTIAESMRQIEESIYSVSRKLLQQVSVMANEVGLGISTGDHIDFGHYALCHFSLHVPRRGISSEKLSHRVELEGPARALVAASYQLGQGSESKSVIYYRGPAADTERLEEEVLGHVDEMFKIVAADLRERLEKAIT